MRFWLHLELHRRRDDDEAARAPISLSEQYVLAEQRATDLMIALAEMERERDMWRPR
jgi:hypothetical protein